MWRLAQVCRVVRCRAPWRQHIFITFTALNAFLTLGKCFLLPLYKYTCVENDQVGCKTNYVTSLFLSSLFLIKKGLLSVVERKSELWDTCFWMKAFISSLLFKYLFCATLNFYSLLIRDQYVHVLTAVVRCNFLHKLHNTNILGWTKMCSKWTYS